MTGIIRQIRDLVRDTWSHLVCGPGAILSLAMALLLLWQYYGYPLTYLIHLDALIGDWRYRAIASSLYWDASNVVLLLIIPLIFARLLGWKPRQLGLGLGNRRFGLIVVGIGWLIMLPLVIGVASSGDFRGVYPLDREALRSHEMFWVYEAGYMSFFVGWEFFFRGFMLFTLEPFFGPAAIVVQMIPFALLHFGKPVLEALGSIIAGLFLGAVAWRTRSIWYGVALHALVAVTMDLYVYFRWGLNP